MLVRLMAPIGNYNVNKSWATLLALELTGNLVQDAPKTNIGRVFFAAIVLIIFECLKATEDSDILQDPFPSYLPVPCQLVQNLPKRGLL